MYHMEKMVQLSVLLFLLVNTALVNGGLTDLKSVDVWLGPSSRTRSQETRFTNSYTVYRIERTGCRQCGSPGDKCPRDNFHFTQTFTLGGFTGHVFKMAADFSHLKIKSCAITVKCNFHLLLSPNCFFSCMTSRWKSKKLRPSLDEPGVDQKLTVTFKGDHPCELSGYIDVSLEPKKEIYHLMESDGACGRPEINSYDGSVASEFVRGQIKKGCALTIYDDTKTSFCFRFVYEDFPTSEFNITFSYGTNRKLWMRFNHRQLPGGAVYCNSLRKTKTHIAIEPDLTRRGNNRHQIFIKYDHEFSLPDGAIVLREDDEESLPLWAKWLIGVGCALAGIVLCCYVCKCCKEEDSTGDTANESGNNAQQDPSRVPMVYVHGTVTAHSSSTDRAMPSAPPPSNYSPLGTPDMGAVPRSRSGSGSVHGYSGEPWPNETHLPSSSPPNRSPLLDRRPEGERGALTVDPPPDYFSLFPSKQ